MRKLIDRLSASDDLTPAYPDLENWRVPPKSGAIAGGEGAIAEGRMIEKGAIVFLMDVIS